MSLHVKYQKVIANHDLTPYTHQKPFNSHKSRTCESEVTITSRSYNYNGRNLSYMLTMKV